MDTIHTFQEFMLQTKNILYLIILMILLAMPAIWKFLNPDDHEENQSQEPKPSHHHHHHHGGA